jgi:pimeloyl-ACP methyl ester carboxylesterase
VIHRRRWSLVSLALTVLALAATSTAAAGLGSKQVEVPNGPTLHSCDIGMARKLYCGHVTVPMRRTDPSLGTTRVAFAIRVASNGYRRAAGTIMAMDGGPGYASTSAPFARSLAAVLAPLLDRFNLVLFDERGTGRSDVVDCPDLQAGLVPEAIAIGECANQLGPSYAGYTTGEAAHDLEAVRQALGLGKVFFYGDSYGTLFGQAYAVRYPSSLRGLILDSAYPANDPYYRTLFPAGRRGLRIACRRSPRCSGDPWRRYSRVVARFHRAGRSTDELLSFLLQAGTLAPRSYLSLDAGDRRFLAGEPRRLNELIAPGPAGHGPLSEFSYGLEIAVECNDYPLLWDRALPGVDERIGQLAGLALVGIGRRYFSPFSRREYLFSNAAHLTTCLNWPVPPAGGLEPPVPAGWKAPTGFPTLILAGEVDDITSVQEAREVKARFPRSDLYVVPGRGHSSSLYFPFRSPAVGVIRGFIASH